LDVAIKAAVKEVMNQANTGNEEKVEKLSETFTTDYSIALDTIANHKAEEWK